MTNTRARYVELESGFYGHRWVKNNRGTVNISDNEKMTDSNKVCGIANQADSYVFAVSWQPAFWTERVSYLTKRS